MPPILVEVTFPAQGSNPLTVNRPEVEIHHHDDWVEWRPAPGVTLPTNATLFVHFAQPLGPFQAVRNVTRSVVVAKGNTGALLTFPYFVFLLLEDGTIIRSETLSLENLSITVNTSPMATVTFIPPDLSDPNDPRPAQLDVQPPTLLLHEGDVAQWQVVGLLPDNHIMAFDFPPPEPTVEGPFRDFFLKPHGSGSQRAGAGIFISSQVRTFTYRIKVWRDDGALVASHDPTVDGLGRPPE